jgi:penicillin G amidase
MIFPRNKRLRTGNLLSSFIRPVLRRWSEKAKPQRQGTILFPGLKETVRVAWSRHAIPHLYASNEHDLFTTQGYIHAQDRLWQMDSSRMLLKGRTAEIYGKRAVPWKEVSVHFKDRSTIDLDYFLRLMGIQTTARASLSQLSEQFVKCLIAYSEGVNRYIESHLKRLPVEFRLLRYEPEPWKPEDCLVIGKGFAFFLSTSLFTRLTMTLLAARLQNQETKLKSLFPSYPEGDPVITRLDLKSAAAVSGAILGFLNGTFYESGWSPAGQGSNSWVVAPARSTTGRAILCNDPHLRMALPSTWYLIHLQAASNGEARDGYEVWGASIPGSPCVHLGHNRWISWGVTAALCDDADLYREKIRPGDRDLYLVEGQWSKMDRREEKIRIRGGREVIKWTRFTRHGPVISDAIREAVADEVLAFQWTAHDASEEFRTLYGVNRAHDWNEFLQSLSHQVAPTLNYVYADAQGNIGYSLAGRVPIRPHSVSLLPLPGWTRQYDWKGYIPFDQLPRLYNPPEEIVATANNRIVDASYPYHLSHLFDPPYRIRRIKELLTAKEKFSLAELAQIQRDVVSVHGREIIAILRSDLCDIAGRDVSLKDPIGRLIQWDRDCSETSVEASLFHVFYQRLTANLLTKDLGEQLFLTYIEIFNQSLTPVAEILGDPKSSWFASYPRLALVETSFREAVEELTLRFGTDVNQWNWGKLHALILRHPFGQSKILEPLFSIGPFPSPGDGVTINMGFYRSSNPYHQFVGPSLRMVIDVGHWSSSRFVIPSGQSGDVFSPYYRDQTELWRRGDSILLSDDDEGRNESPLLTLTPPGTRS